MLRRARPPSQSYHVATVCGEPSGRIVATTAGFGSRRKSSSSGGSGTGGTAEPYAPAAPPHAGDSEQIDASRSDCVAAAMSDNDALTSAQGVARLA